MHKFAQVCTLALLVAMSSPLLRTWEPGRILRLAIATEMKLDEWFGGYKIKYVTCDKDDPCQLQLWKPKRARGFWKLGFFAADLDIPPHGNCYWTSGELKIIYCKSPRS